ncbi:hypothetical protein KUL42_39080 [Alteromonas sp. KUL42]|uniref:hypothetical protein n=1 Tax=Alteromonas sp. KUL42 TaxID=2480797 RepID=UPI001035B488|nr:hypothetical protein [Alteromonas sp. KUL42]TAP31714.1 hypothetical protein EYR97_19695 [Alteromonas sp. KUL42]GEA09147.1 hypothetical protein KUL42_39080 [Alteromonas sp. KUL42]
MKLGVVGKYSLKFLILITIALIVLVGIASLDVAKWTRTLGSMDSAWTSLYSYLRFLKYGAFIYIGFRWRLCCQYVARKKFSGNDEQIAEFTEQLVARWPTFLTMVLFIEIVGIVSRGGL